MHGYALAFRIGTVLLVVGGVLVLALLERVLVVPPDEATVHEAGALPDAVAPVAAG